MSTTNYSDAEVQPSILGRELRYRREAAGLSQDDLAKQINCSRSLVQAMEKGRRTMAPELADACDLLFETDGLFARLRKSVVRQTAPWPSFRAWLGVEREARRLRGYESVVVPGLFQTSAYAEVVLDYNQDALAARLDRQDLLWTDNPPEVRYLLDEGILSRPIGGPEIMAEQLERLLELGATGKFRIQVVPLGAAPKCTGSFVLATIDDDTLGYEEATTQGLLLTKRQDVLALEREYDDLVAEALPATASLEMIRRMMEQWKT